ncbi:MAG: hypothetical protein MK135_13650, partial [Polyangiaceae bacterium]|nr:hypothetical protein [Polyangiaceae bacterium]
MKNVLLEKYCTEDELHEARARQTIFGGALTTSLLELKFINEDELLQTLALTFGSFEIQGPIQVEISRSQLMRDRGYAFVVSVQPSLLLIGTAPPSPAEAEVLQQLLGEFSVAITTEARYLEAQALIDSEALEPRLEKLLADGKRSSIDTQAPPLEKEEQVTPADPFANHSQPSIEDVTAVPPRAAQIQEQSDDFEEEPQQSVDISVTAPPPVDYEEVRSSAAPPSPFEKARSAPSSPEAFLEQLS